MQTGWITAIPFVCGTIGILVCGHLSDRMNERRWNPRCLLLMYGRWIGRGGALQGSFWSIAGLSLAMIGLYAGSAHLFPIPSMFLTGAAAASGIAWLGILALTSGGYGVRLVNDSL
jgi:MFS transporter, ACS family, tartrate transporter